MNNASEDAGGDDRGDGVRVAPATSLSIVSLRHTFSLLSQLMSQMQNATLTIDRKTERTGEAIRALAKSVKSQNQRLYSLENRLQVVEGKLDAEDEEEEEKEEEEEEGGGGEERGDDKYGTASTQVAMDDQIETSSEREALDSGPFHNGTQEAQTQLNSEDLSEAASTEPDCPSIGEEDAVKSDPNVPNPTHNVAAGHATEAAVAVAQVDSPPIPATSAALVPATSPPVPIAPAPAPFDLLSDLGKVLLHVTKEGRAVLRESGRSSSVSASSSASSAVGSPDRSSQRVAMNTEKRSRIPEMGISPARKMSKTDLECHPKMQRFTSTKTSQSPPHPSILKPSTRHNNSSSINSSIDKSSPVSRGASTRTTNGAAAGAMKPEILGRKLLKAAQKGNVNIVKNLLQDGADVNYHNSWKWSALHWAAMKAHSGVVALLLRKGADVNAVTSLGNIALHMAAYNDRKGRCASLLIEAGSYVDIWNQFGRTPLHLGAECGNAAVVKALLAAGATRTAKDVDGRTPFHVAKTSSVRNFLL